MANQNNNENNNNRESGKFNRFLNWLDKVSTKHWVVSSIFIVGSSWWFSVVIAFWGENLGLIQTSNSNKGFTLLGGILTFLIFIVLVLNAALVKYRKETPDKALKDMTASFNLLDRLMSSMSQVCAGKLSTQIKKIEEIKQNGIEPPIIYSKPCMQFEIILREIIDCLTFVLNTNDHRIKADSLYASIAYNFPLESDVEWRWVDVQKQQGLDIPTLLKEESLFASLLNSPNKSYEFFNSKQLALEKHKYVQDDCDKQDKDGNLLVSIACFEITITRNDITFIRAILSISSYDIQFVNSNNLREENQQDIINTRENIRKIIVSEFSKRIRIELCNYYLQFLRHKWDKQHNTI